MQNSSAQIFAQRRPVLKAMSRASARDPDIFKLRMAVDQEIAVGAVLILADARLVERPPRERRKAPRHVGAHQIGRAHV